VLKKIIDQLNIPNQCRRYGLTLWQCPQFLFLVMGLFIFLTALASYLIGTSLITDPILVAFIVIILTAILFVLSFIITRSFERLAEASRMKSEFINIVSHQLRSPLTNIKWINDFLTSDSVELGAEKKEEYFSQMKENIKRMTELIDELLIVARIEQGAFPIRKREDSLTRLVSDQVSRFKAFAEASKAELVLHIQESLPNIYFDPSLIKLVVENLIDNAIRYIKLGGKIEIKLERKDKKLLFAIKDNGVGIPQEDQKYIFQKFFRSDNALREQTKGSGLGLYIAKIIIEESGGKIWFESKEGKGTTFYFTLPTK